MLAAVMHWHYTKSSLCDTFQCRIIYHILLEGDNYALS